MRGIDMEAEIEFDESAIIEGVMSEIDSGMIEASVLGHLENTDFTEYVEAGVEGVIDNFMSNMDLSDYVEISDYIDTSDIRYEIEDDILEQVNDHLCYDTIKYNIEDDIAESVFSGFDIDDYIDYDTIKEGLEYDELEDRVESLEIQLQALEACYNSPRKAGLITRILGWLW